MKVDFSKISKTQQKISKVLFIGGLLIFFLIPFTMIFPVIKFILLLYVLALVVNSICIVKSFIMNDK